MINEAKKIYDLIQEDIQHLPLNEFLLSPEEENNLRAQKVENLVARHLNSFALDIQTPRTCRDEFFGAALRSDGR